MRIEHAAMYVNDLEGVREFFMRYFGAECNDGYHNRVTDFCSYFLSFDGGARLEIMNRPNMIDSEKWPDRTGLAHLAFSVGSAEKVDSLTQTLHQAGYKVLSGPRTTGDGYYESCIAGPEGNILEITV